MQQRARLYCLRGVVQLQRCDGLRLGQPSLGQARVGRPWQRGAEIVHCEDFAHRPQRIAEAAHDRQRPVWRLGAHLPVEGELALGHLVVKARVGERAVLSAAVLVLGGVTGVKAELGPVDA